MIRKNKHHKHHQITGSEIRAMSERIGTLASNTMEEGLAVSKIETMEDTISALIEMVTTSAGAVGVLSGTVTPDADIPILIRLQTTLDMLSEITAATMEDIDAEHGFELDNIDPSDYGPLRHRKVRQMMREYAENYEQE